MATKQELLAELYCSKLADAKISRKLGMRLSCPLLISVLPRWESAEHRVLIVGKETLKYGFLDEATAVPKREITSFTDLVTLPNLADAVDALTRKYKIFVSDESTTNKKTPFWKAFEKFGQPKDVTLWSNLFWCSLDHGSTWNKSTSSEIKEIYGLQRGRLRKEIELLNPTAVVFFTGPSYDEAIEEEFGDALWVEVNELPLRGFSQIVSNYLPENSYRLYHPNYLQQKHLWGWLDILDQLIHSQAGQRFSS